MFIWYNIWIGLFIDKKNKCIYFCPLPCCVIRFSWGLWYTVSYDHNTNKMKYILPNLSWLEKLFKKNRSNNE